MLSNKDKGALNGQCRNDQTTTKLSSLRQWSTTGLAGGGSARAGFPVDRTPLVLSDKSDLTQIEIQIEFPERGNLVCPFCQHRKFSCSTKYRDNARMGLKKHLMTTQHGYRSVNLSVICGICKAVPPKSSKSAVRWMNGHIETDHPEHIISDSDIVEASNGEHPCETCGQRFARKYTRDTHAKSCANKVTNSQTSRSDIRKSFGLGRVTKPTDRNLTSTSVFTEAVTPTKADIECLEARPQTRSTTKKLSAVKSRVEAASALKKSPIQPRKVLLTISEIDNESQSRRNSAVRDIFSRRTSLIPVQTSRRKLSIASGTTTLKPRSEKSQTTLTSGELTSTNGESKESHDGISEEELKQILKAIGEHVDLKCLQHTRGKEAWLTSDVVVAYLCNKISSPSVKVIHPLVWNTNGVEILKKHIQHSQYRYVFPVCIRNHWRLLFIDPKQVSCAYYDPLKQHCPADVKERMKEIGYQVTHPLGGLRQTDDTSCGIHVCLLAQRLAENQPPYYATDDVNSFRDKALALLSGLNESSKNKDVDIRANDDMLQPINEVFESQLTIDEPLTEQFANPEESDCQCPDTNSPSDPIALSMNSNEQIPDLVIEEPNHSDDEKLSDTLSDSFMDETFELSQILETSEIINNTDSDQRVFIERTEPLAVKSLMTLHLTELPMFSDPKLTIQTWFYRQFKDYVEQGTIFSRLEWICEQLAALTFQLSRNNKKEIEKIVKRCPRPEISQGDMCTQTDPPGKTVRATKPPLQLWNAKDMRRAYKDNRCLTFRKIVGEQSLRCQIEPKKAYDFFKTSTTQTYTDVKVLEKLAAGIPKAQVPSDFMRDFTVAEIEHVFKKAKDTAPGTDGVRYKHLRDMDKTCDILFMLYNELKRVRQIPKIWKESETTLILKGGDVSDPSNWRPISLLSTMYKVYSSLWNNRLKEVEGVISPVQRGFSSRNGCSDSIALLRAAIEHSRAQRGTMAVAWLDLTNAFGTVPHELITFSLEQFGFPSGFVDVISNIYKDNFMRVVTAETKTQPIPILSGVKQGDPISPTLFNLSLEMIIRDHLKSARGYKMIQSRIKILAFADDMAIISDSQKTLQNELNNLDSNAAKLNLIFKPKKCASLVLTKGDANPTLKVSVRNEEIRALSGKDFYPYLGVKIGSESIQSSDDLVLSAAQDIGKISESFLAPWQKLDALRTFILPRFSHIALNGLPNMTSLNALSEGVRAHVKAIHNLPNMGTPSDYVQIPVKKGGLGIMCPLTSFMIASIASCLRKLWSTDKYLTKIHSDHIMETAKAHFEKDTVSMKDVVEYLNGASQPRDRKIRKNSFFRVRQAVKHLANDKTSPLHLLEFREEEGEMTLAVKSTEESTLKVFRRKNAKDLLRLIRTEVENGIFARFTKCSTGQSLKAAARDKRNNTFVNSGGLLSLAGHRYVHRARLDALTLGNSRVTKHRTDEVRNCRRCQSDSETLFHVLQYCRPSMPLITARHDAVLARLVHGIRSGAKKDWKLTIDKKCRLDMRTTMRPDIILENAEKKEVVICDVAIPWETCPSMEKRHNQKIDKYAFLADEYLKRGYSVVNSPVVIGCHGSWRPENDVAVSELGIPNLYAKKMIPLIAAQTIEFSKNIYWKHIFGEKYRYQDPHVPTLKPIGKTWEFVEREATETDDDDSDEIFHGITLEDELDESQQSSE